jgi:hypothetical protein
MTIAAIASSGFHAAAQQTQSLSQHRQGGHRSASISDVDTVGSSVAAPPSATGKTGAKLNVVA